MMVGSSRSGEAVVTKEPSPPSAIAARRPNFALDRLDRLGLGQGQENLLPLPWPCLLSCFSSFDNPVPMTMGAMLLLLLVVLASVETAVVVPVV